MMKRVIQFRAWDGKRMFYFDNSWQYDLVYNKISGWNVIPNLPPEELKGMKWTTGESSETAKHFELMQFTGLLDKNGKEIFEGDIVRFPDTEVLRQIIWDTGAFQVVAIGHTWNYPLHFHKFKNSPITFEIIGNLFENPEMLNP